MAGKRTAIRLRYGRLDVGYMTIKAALLAKLDVLLLGYSSFQNYSKREFQQIHIPGIAWDHTESVKFTRYGNKKKQLNDACDQGLAGGSGNMLCKKSIKYWESKGLFVCLSKTRSGKKMTGGTPVVRSDKSLSLLTLNIWHSTNGPMDQRTNGPMD